LGSADRESADESGGDSLDPRTYTISTNFASPPTLVRSVTLSPSSSWWRPDVHAANRPFLAARGRIRAAVRGWFEQRAFVEVETAALQVSPGNEAHLHAFSARLEGPDGSDALLFLRTSPEFACKSLLAAGERRIFELGKVWRNRERGLLHHPEFTLLEWYRAEESYEALMIDCAQLLALAAEAAGTRALRWKDRQADPFAEPERLTVAQAFERFAAVDLLATVAADGATDRDNLAAGARAAGVRVAEDDTWSDIYSKTLVQLIEPNLGLGRATILCEYPIVEAALAKPMASDPRVAERFELYACGVELANAFGELTDPALQRERFQAEMAEKSRIYGERYPIDEAFLDALGHMPEASGAALGFDRLVMLASGAERIEQVIWSPVAETEP
jgi:lysyl-tRNA synthetase class 2